MAIDEKMVVKKMVVKVCVTGAVMAARKDQRYIYIYICSVEGNMVG